MSTSIEGNLMTEPEVRALFARAHPASADRAERENLDYRDAARFAQQVANDQHADLDEGVVRALHFMVERTTDDYGTPGQYRTEQNQITHAGRRVYLPPSADDVPRLMRDLVAWLREQRGELHPLILAAVAHLEFVGIHPFDDGNGRTARALTSYFAARGNWTLRGLVQTEATFGRDRMRYYAELQRYQSPSYPPPSRDVTDWCVWVLRRYAIEIVTTIGIIQYWNELLARPDPWGTKFQPGYMYLALSGSASSSEYARAVGISAASAVTQLNLMLESEWVRREGRGRSTRYVYQSDHTALVADVCYGRAVARLGEP
ncbi:MAG: Fic family protein [Chloroflexi bacterium]|nr:Fic family protein [Chloroflexota bacterium]